MWQIRRKLRIWSHLLKKSFNRKLHFLCSVNQASFESSDENGRVFELWKLIRFIVLVSAESGTKWCKRLYTHTVIVTQKPVILEPHVEHKMLFGESWSITRIQNPVRHLRWLFLRKQLTVNGLNCFRKTLHLRCLTGFWIQRCHAFHIQHEVSL